MTGAGHPGGIHLAQQIVFGKRLRPVRAMAAFGWPGPLGRIGGPDMHLRIDNQHAVAPV
jgi:hypothetical protein